MQSRIPNKEKATQHIKIIHGSPEHCDMVLNEFLDTMEERHIFEMAPGIYPRYYSQDMTFVLNYRVAHEYIVVEHDADGQNQRRVGVETPDGVRIPKIELLLP